MTVMRARAPRVPVVVCKPWCEYPDGHPDCMCVEDQVCYTAELYVPLSSEQQSVYCAPGVVLSPAEKVTVYAGQVPGRDVQVAIGPDDLTPMYLTPAETHQLIENLQLILGQIEGSATA